MFSVKKTVMAAFFIALGVVLPVMLHSVPNAGSVLLPMHIPVMMCGIICGFPYGLICGVLTPVTSFLLTGMPPAAFLVQMICELAAYGLISSLLTRFVKTGNTCANIFIALIGAMLAGRVVFGVLNALIFRAGSYSFQIWLASAFVTALPGIVIQLVLIPAVVIALRRTKLIEANG
ncbi:MAG: ECF transporter S component [Clostridiales bacterium]|nr:ECF transporter S component [Clostridiales bacterium]